MSTPLFSIGGLASGLDTAGIIEQLMSLERQPIRNFQQRQAELRRVDDAWSRVVTKLSGLRSAVDSLVDPTSLRKALTSTSSDEDAVTVSTSGAAAVGSTSFTVERLATTHQTAFDGTFSSLDELVGAGTVTLTEGDGSATTVATDASTTLQDLVTAVNRDSDDVSAQAIKTTSGTYQLVLTGRSSGADGAFTATTDVAKLGASTVLQTGLDAQLRLGTLLVERSSNTVDDLIDGVTLRLRGVTATPVTVSIERDTDAVVEQVQGLVDAANALLASLKKESAYDADTRTSAPLQGDAAVRRLTGDLRAAVTGAVDGLTGAYTSGSTIGLGLSKDGSITLDETKLRAAVAADLDGVVSLLSRAGAATDPGVSYVKSTTATAPGTYAVEITQLASAASATAAAPYAAPAVDWTFDITSDEGTTVTVTVKKNTTLATAVASINTQLSDAGVTSIRAEDDGTGTLRLGETRVGQAFSMTVSGSGDAGLDGTHTGTNVAGTIDGEAAVGTGRELLATTGAAAGMRLRIAGTTTGARGSVTVTGGLTGAVDAVLDVHEGRDGTIARARETLESEIDRYDDRIADFEVRLASRETTMRRKFAALETALGRLQSESAWLSAQLFPQQS